MRNHTRSPIDLTCRCHFGGGGKAPAAPQMPVMPQFKMPEMPPMPTMPPMPETPPPPAPIPERVDMGVTDASNAQREEAARREGVRRSVIAGETGGYSNPVTGNSLLG